MNSRRVVVTGLGVISPLGNSTGEVWTNLLNGKSGISQIRSFDASSYNSRIAGEVKNFNLADFYPPASVGKAKKLDNFVHYAQAASKQAIEEAGLEITEANSARIGISFGTGIGGIKSHTDQVLVFMKKGHKRVTPYFVPAVIGNMAAGFVSIQFKIKGPNASLQTACATGNHSISYGELLIKSNKADVMIVGASESAVQEITLAGFCNMRALSTSYNESPETASRPFDKGRDGFVLAEGAAALVLEDYDHAMKRGATILAELVTVGMSGDANDMVMPCSDGEGAYLSMTNALTQGQVNADEIDYFNFHGTSTPLGDSAESQAVLRLFSNGKDLPHMGSTKSMTGHMIAAASAVEAVISILSIKNNLVPPNINIFDLDESLGLDLNVLNQEPVEKEVKYVLSNSFGFGGHNSSAIFKKI